MQGDIRLTDMTNRISEWTVQILNNSIGIQIVPLPLGKAWMYFSSNYVKITEQLEPFNYVKAVQLRRIL